MKKEPQQVGVILFPEAFDLLESQLAPYVQSGASGKFIYCQSAVQEGGFLKMTFSPDQYKGGGEDLISIFVPAHFVKFMAACVDPGTTIGF